VDVCGVSQYDALLRILLDLPLSAHQEDHTVTVRGPGSVCAVVRLEMGPSADCDSSLAEHARMCRAALSVGGCFSHWYGWSAAGGGGQAGHITAVAASPSQLSVQLETLGFGKGVLCDEGEGGTKPAAAVAIVVNSRNELSFIESGVAVLEELDISYDVCIASAHLTPSRVYAFAETAADRGYGVIIAVSRGEPHLANMISSLTSLPVVAYLLPPAGGPAGALSLGGGGGGIPVGCVASADGLEPALFAARILAAGGSACGRGKAHQLRELLQNQNIEREAATIHDAVRLESVGYREFTKGLPR
jgi:phosphoribosylaminoimidazole carboxylase PurE protein